MWCRLQILPISVFQKLASLHCGRVVRSRIIPDWPSIRPQERQVVSSCYSPTSKKCRPKSCHTLQNVMYCTIVNPKENSRIFMFNLYLTNCKDNLPYFQNYKIKLFITIMFKYALFEKCFTSVYFMASPLFVLFLSMVESGPTCSQAGVNHTGSYHQNRASREE